MLRSSHLLLLGFVVVGCAAPGMADRLSADDSDNGELKELVGGVDAKSADFPSTILIRGNCTASKIAPNKIVTAAHCVYDPKTKAWGAAYQTGTIGVSSAPNPETQSTNPTVGFVDVRITGAYVDPAWAPNQTVGGTTDSLSKTYYNSSDLAVIVVDEKDAIQDRRHPRHAGRSHFAAGADLGRDHGIRL